MGVEVSMTLSLFLVLGAVVDVILMGLVKSDLVILLAYVAPSCQGLLELISVVKRCYDAMPVRGLFLIDLYPTDMGHLSCIVFYIE